MQIINPMSEYTNAKAMLEVELKAAFHMFDMEGKGYIKLKVA